MTERNARPDALWETYRAFLCDLDGVVYRGASSVPHAISALDALGRERPVLFVTNNASRRPAEVAAILVGLGLETDQAHVVTSAQAIAAVMSEELAPGDPVLVCGAEALVAAVHAEGLVAVPVDAAQERSRNAGAPVRAVVQGLGMQLRAADFAQAALAIQAGARWFASNADPTLPTEHGLMPGAGSYLALVGATLPTDRAPVIAGKPEPPLYRLAAQRVSTDLGDCLAIGDRLDTDILGANRAGCDSLWVLTGVNDLAGLFDGEPQNWARPTYTGLDLRALGRPGLTAVHGDGGWVAGGTRVVLRPEEPWVRIDNRRAPAPGAQAGETTADPAGEVLAAGVAALLEARAASGADGWRTETLVRAAGDLERAARAAARD